MQGWRAHVALGLVGFAAVALFVAFRPIVVAGRSMEPTLVPGDLCLAATMMTPGTGDIALVSPSGKRSMLHRVVGVTGSTYVTQGDANAHPDLEAATRTEVRGRVVVVVPFGKALRGWMRAVRDATLLTQSR